jgi:hypothetical protein
MVKLQSVYSGVCKVMRADFFKLEVRKIVRTFSNL